MEEPQPRLTKVQINKRMDDVFSKIFHSNSGIVYYAGMLEYHFANYLITLPFDEANEILEKFENLPDRITNRPEEKG
jgi:hypothetical protein